MLKKDGLAPLFLRLTINGKRWDSSLQTGIKVPDWDPRSMRATGEDEDSILINEIIESTIFRLHKIKLAIEDEGSILSIDTVKTRFREKDSERKSILRLFSKHNEECERKIGIQITKATAQRYETCYRHFSEFLAREYKVRDLPVFEIRRDLYEKFEVFLKKEKKCSHNTAVKYIRNFNKIVRIAVELGWIAKSPYKEIGYRLEEIDKPYLTTDELNTIFNKEFAIKRIEVIRDIFIFGCYTGLSFSDIKELSSENIQTGVDNNKWIIKKRKKTSVLSMIPLLEIPESIIKKYSSFPGLEDKSVLLPIPSNQKMNAYLKEIADLTGIRKLLTTHTARRTFATTIMLRNGVSMEAVSKMLGHTSLFMTRKYAKIDEFYIAHETVKVRELFANSG